MMPQIGVPTTINLTESEKVAKEFFFRSLREADNLRCDDEGTDLEPALPCWYDETKYKRAQKYFTNNWAGISSSNMAGLICLLAPYKGVQILHATGRSSTAETARKRYVSTVMHTLSWYQHDLKPGSESWKSLAQVRRMHYYASRSTEKKKIGFITQMEMAAAQFGFMGFALLRPHIFGITHDNDEDIEAFVHFWAVIGHMLGIKDEYNICLHPIEIVKVISLVILRYVLLPLIQLETELFKLMTNAMLDGLNKFLPFMSYDQQLFITRRALCVPGYQYRVDHERETLSRSIFTEEDITKMRKLSESDEYLKFVFFSKIPVYKIADISGDLERTFGDTVVENGKRRPMDERFKMELRKYLNLDESKSIELTFIDYESEWKASLSDSRFFELDRTTRWSLAVVIRIIKSLENRIGRFISNLLMRLNAWSFRRYLKKYKR